jgi:hypothetical protein
LRLVRRPAATVDSFPHHTPITREIAEAGN